MPEDKREEPAPDTRVTIFLPREWHEELRLRAYRERKSIGRLIRDLMRQEFRPKDPPQQYAT